MNEYVMRSLEETATFGEKLAEELKAGDTLALVGDLGSGKTTLTKSIAKGLGVEETITSPTFAIVNEYHSGRVPLYHFDAYRLEGLEDAFNRGIEEYFYMNGVCVVEWAEKIQEILPENTRCIFMEQGENEEERILRCTF